jgi:hypothetical protein
MCLVQVFMKQPLVHLALEEEPLHVNNLGLELNLQKNSAGLT